MKVKKREFVLEFSLLSCPGQTRTRVASELMRVERRHVLVKHKLEFHESLY